LPIPMVDIATIVKENEEVVPKVFGLAKDIQKKIYENQIGVRFDNLIILLNLNCFSFNRLSVINIFDLKCFFF
jgi:hypothetical protein